MFTPPYEDLFEDINFEDLETIEDIDDCKNWLLKTKSQFFVELSDAQLARPYDKRLVAEIKSDIAQISLRLNELQIIRTETQRKQTKRLDKYIAREHQRRLVSQLTPEEREAEKLAAIEKRERHVAQETAARAAKAERVAAQKAAQETFERLFIDKVRMEYPETYQLVRDSIFLHYPRVRPE